MRLEGKVAVITGAGSGIGRAIATRFAKEGAKVAVNDINASAGESLVAQIAAEGGAAFFLKGDAASEEDISALMRAVNERFGTLHILVNNAVPGMDEVNSNRWDTVVQVGLKRVLALHAGGDSLDAAYRLWQHCEYLFRQRPDGSWEGSRL